MSKKCPEAITRQDDQTTGKINTKSCIRDSGWECEIYNDWLNETEWLNEELNEEVK